MSGLILKFEMLSESGKTELPQYLENLLKRQSRPKMKEDFDGEISPVIDQGKLSTLAEKAINDFKKGISLQKQIQLST